ncbi:hypothetical protein [Occallatibacter riparius]|uniref:Uncharacterized protein n=1 Tax=Occallatibacter riparius TaxID=1002689 RepID=A0A9J7BXX0_9BACT|nr:hypothetical protein [Occallatibacter riparius]UWZ86125.1 hypothetical protein MOP44_09295 [Occallatibacter riparius]
MALERVLFGDNQFFGVNHMSEEKARAQSIRFKDTESVIDVLEIAYDEGIRVFMCTTHDRIAEVCDYFRANQARYADFKFYPCMPYAHKYANAVTELGMIGALKSFLPEEGKISALFKGGMSVARKDLEGMMTLFIDAEMKMFQGLETPVIFLQNVFVDLILGLGMHDVFRMFADHVRSKYKAEPGYITMNAPMLLDVLEGLGLENPIICADINKLGFRMCGGMKKYEEMIATRKFQPIAMSVLASGAIPAREAIEYVCSQPNIKSIVFGASSRGNIHQTKTLIDELTRSETEEAVGAR